MRKIITLILLLFTFSFYAQEVERQKVIIEVGTGTWCPSCPAVVHIIHDLIADGADVAVVEYHINDPYQNSEALIRKDFYDFPWYPTTYYDSNHIGYDDWATYSVHESYYQASIAETSSFAVSVDASVGEFDLTGNISIDKVANYTGANLVLHIALTESDIPEIWQGETELDFTERAMYPDGHGTALDFSTGDNQEVSFDFSIDPSWVKENCELVYFVQDNDTGKIVQGDSVLVEDIILGVGDNIVQESNSYFYPNPVKNELRLYAEDPSEITNITITNMLGAKIFAQDEYTSPINFERFSQGVYLVSYEENGSPKTAKIVKK